MEERCLGHAGAAIGDGGRRVTDMPVGCELGFGFGQMVGRMGCRQTLPARREVLDDHHSPGQVCCVCKSAAARSLSLFGRICKCPSWSEYLSTRTGHGHGGCGGFEQERVQATEAISPQL
jgi:hypothetical protein